MTDPVSYLASCACDPQAWRPRRSWARRPGHLRRQPWEAGPGTAADGERGRGRGGRVRRRVRRRVGVRPLRAHPWRRPDP